MPDNGASAGKDKIIICDNGFSSITGDLLIKTRAVQRFSDHSGFLVMVIVKVSSKKVTKENIYLPQNGTCLQTRTLRKHRNKILIENLPKLGNGKLPKSQIWTVLRGPLFV